ncbi:uncharacterized protein TNCV_3785241 [Trichonephila clavipes]|nr:uncharacterized protein TNCV_3785241 [Trichonephila clavipes]
MATHTITPAVGAVCRCKAKAGLRRSPLDLLTRTRLSSLPRLNLDSSLKTTWFHFVAVQFPRARHHSKRRRRWVGVKGSTRNGRRDPKCPPARRLRMTFGDRLISRLGPVNWPPRSCDLPLDYFLWGYVKSLVYADKPQTLDHLEDNIRRVIADMRPQMLEKVIENWTSRLDYIRASHMPEIIFKM